jgi:hypothetical protein
MALTRRFALPGCFAGCGAYDRERPDLSFVISAKAIAGLPRGFCPVGFAPNDDNWRAFQPKPVHFAQKRSIGI